MIVFSDAEIEAAARQLLHEGQFCGWWGKPLEFDPQAYDKMDVIGREEFDAVVDRVLRAAAKARGAT